MSQYIIGMHDLYIHMSVPAMAAKSTCTLHLSKSITSCFRAFTPAASRKLIGPQSITTLRTLHHGVVIHVIYFLLQDSRILPLFLSYFSKSSGSCMVVLFCGVLSYMYYVYALELHYACDCSHTCVCTYTRTMYKSKMLHVLPMLRYTCTLYNRQMLYFTN